ncbi:MAG: hypothetical protein PWQ79_1820 [Thermococcaceae archaeon]|nr:hypothetical protein [Thermococcaceae archaeon]MDK2914905.1 hypothetical protein [Thermococcaceae archaeon]
MNSRKKFFELLDRAPFGNLVVVEDYTSYAIPGVLKVLFDYADNRGLEVIVDDILDTFPLAVKHLEMVGIERDFSTVKVIKTAGSINTAKVLARIPFESELSVYIERYNRVASEVLPTGGYINAVLGMERLFSFFQRTGEFHTLINSIKTYLGNEHRKAFYLIDANVASNLRFKPLPMLESIATSVVSIEPLDGGEVRIFIKKSIFRDRLGKELIVSPLEVYEW